MSFGPISVKFSILKTRVTANYVKSVKFKIKKSWMISNLVNLLMSTKNLLDLPVQTIKLAEFGKLN